MEKIIDILALDFLLGFTQLQVDIFVVSIVFLLGGLGFFILKTSAGFKNTYLQVFTLYFSLSIPFVMLVLVLVDWSSNISNSYLRTQNVNWVIDDEKLYKLEKKEIVLSDDVKMNKDEKILIGRLECGSLNLKNCLDLLIKNKEVITAQGSENSSINVANFK